MTTLTTEKQKSTKQKKQSFGRVDIGSPKVPFRKTKKIKQEHELLSDWEHAS
ncbi:hypothetical protein H6G80_20585 [Nostoc sp. FACHB-87]|uniref:hypothetical protein n=1 Tax=Nostocales TaxID=1161 RepID=UPI001681FB4B|nr:MULTISPECIES: hypothetical protein [Nostocales]MBD2298453.1 hypothetical protein [Nostoc sp. FACHB-190]MBD2456462.1 hypothetical protein [Nostoc sp. FACHB-87]MBD2473994.1 hypothetical protein [Anabaena sp. FACHB-83]MBD2488592.1 hypothetical protein [Aulosira sp. FACHB-615]